MAQAPRWVWGRKRDNADHVTDSARQAWLIVSSKSTWAWWSY